MHVISSFGKSQDSSIETDLHLSPLRKESSQPYS